MIINLKEIKLPDDEGLRERIIQQSRDLNKIIEAGRRVGNTTRLADYYIQQLFNTGFCIIRDHHPTKMASENLFQIIWNRLYKEHQMHDSLLYDNNLVIMMHTEFKPLVRKIIDKYEFGEY